MQYIQGNIHIHIWEKHKRKESLWHFEILYMSVTVAQESLVGEFVTIRCYSHAILRGSLGWSFVNIGCESSLVDPAALKQQGVGVRVGCADGSRGRPSVTLALARRLPLLSPSTVAPEAQPHCRELCKPARRTSTPCWDVGQRPSNSGRRA